MVAYVHLWILEGLLRKWVPGMDDVFYFARDGLLVATLCYAGLAKKSDRRSAPWFWSLALVLTVLSLTQMIAGKMDLLVGLTGLRSYVAPLLLAYAAWRYRPTGLGDRLAALLIRYAPLQAVLCVVQVLSGPTSWINKEVGTEEAGFVNGSIVRASGTFSSPAGLSLYIPLALCLSLTLAKSEMRRTRHAAQFGVASSLLLGTISGSRGTVLACVIVLLAFAIYELSRLSSAGMLNALLIASAVASAAVLSYFLLPEVVESFTDRFENASRSENSLDRIIKQTFEFLHYPMDWLGNGAGVHSQAGIGLGSQARWLEIDTVRWVGELGITGWILGLLRLVLATCSLLIALIKLRSIGLFQIMVLSSILPVAFYGSITQYPTAQGFISIGLALLILHQDKGLQMVPRTPKFVQRSK